ATARSSSTSRTSTSGIRRFAPSARCRTAIRPFCPRRQASSHRSVSPTDRGQLEMSLRNTHQSVTELARLGGRARRVCVAMVLAAASGLMACNQLLDVNNPASVPSDALSDPTLAPTLTAAAMQTLQCGVMQYDAATAMLAGEYWSGNGFVDNHPWEWRGIVQIKQAPGS